MSIDSILLLRPYKLRLFYKGSLFINKSQEIPLSKPITAHSILMPSLH